jgi:hypothetical protein
MEAAVQASQPFHGRVLCVAHCLACLAFIGDRSSARERQGDDLCRWNPGWTGRARRADFLISRSTTCATFVEAVIQAGGSKMGLHSNCPALSTPFTQGGAESARHVQPEVSRRRYRGAAQQARRRGVCRKGIAETTKRVQARDALLTDEGRVSGCQSRRPAKSGRPSLDGPARRGRAGPFRRFSSAYPPAAAARYRKRREHRRPRSGRCRHRPRTPPARHACRPKPTPPTNPRS